MRLGVRRHHDPLAPVLKDEIPEIEEAARYVSAGGKLLRYGDKVFFENNIRAVDPSFLEMFAFPLALGTVDAALESPYSIVISKEMNEKYFGSEDSLGKSILVNNEHEFMVTGVLDTLPHNSILQFDFLIPYEFLKITKATIESFGTNSIQTFVRLRDNVTEVQVNDKIREFLKTRMPQTRTTLILMPFTQIHLHAYFGWNRDPGAIQYVYIFSIIALFVLLIACINFMNLSTARSANRAKEVGLRKVVGAQKHHLIRQFYGESIVYAFIALVFAAILVTILLPVFSKLAGLLIIGTTIVYKQLNYMKHKNLGWDKEQLLYVALRGDIGDSYETLKSELTKDPRIMNVTASSHIPTNIGSNSGGADWDGRDPELSVLISTSAVDFDYIEALKIEMSEGRSFSKEFPADSTSSFIVNEEVVKIMDKDSVVGERFSFMGREGSIVGVMKNFHFQSVRSTIEPLAIAIIPEYFEVMLIRFADGDLAASTEYLKDTWNRIVPNYPLEFTFLDERVDRMYRVEERISILLKYFAVLAVLIACLGLFGLASFTAEQRTKEIGIRKILGASAQKITVMLCKEFFILVIISNALAIPAAYFLMRNWLQGYAYRTTLNSVVFLGAMAGALTIALITVSFQAVRAALANPADSLRYE